MSKQPKAFITVKPPAKTLALANGKRYSADKPSPTSNPAEIAAARANGFLQVMFVDEQGEQIPAPPKKKPAPAPASMEDVASKRADDDDDDVAGDDGDGEPTAPAGKPAAKPAAPAKPAASGKPAKPAPAASKPASGRTNKPDSDA